MPLLKPLPGDLADRQTILELKINHSNVEMDQEDKVKIDKNKLGFTQSRVLVNKDAPNVAPFLDELDLVRAELTKKWVPDLVARNLVEKYDELYAELEKLNAQMWELEDEIRALGSAPDSVNRTISWLNLVANCAMEIYRTNDKRSETIKKINAVWGYYIVEKLY